MLTFSRSYVTKKNVWEVSQTNRFRQRCTAQSCCDELSVCLLNFGEDMNVLVSQE